MIFRKQNITKGYKRNTYIDFYHSTYSHDNKSQIELKNISKETKIEISDEQYLNWESPSAITNCIITISEDNQLYKSEKLDLILQFCNLNLCKHIVIRIQSILQIKDIEAVLLKLSKYELHSVLVICDFDEEYYTDRFGEVIMSLQINKRLIVLNSPFEKNFEDTMFFTEKSNLYSTEKTQMEITSNITLFSESISHNVYFNRKFFIGVSGEIKNGPECHNIHGNIKNINTIEELSAIIKNDDFQKYWFVHKDISDVCKDCEFRHMCVDNRLPFQRSENEWYHKTECNYNPYIAKWQGEEGYRTLSECGVISNERGFSIDHERIAKINENLWEK